MSDTKRSSLPTHCRAIITDETGRWLLVLPAGRPPWWFIPGGTQEDDQSPRQTVRREVREELGVWLRLANPEPVLVSWTWPRRGKRRGRYSFLFDLGVHDAAALDARIVLQAGEIAEYRWVPPPLALSMLHPGLAERLAAWQRGQRYIEQKPFDLALRPAG